MTTPREVPGFIVDPPEQRSYRVRAISPDRRHLVVAGEREVRIYNLSSGAEIRRIKIWRDNEPAVKPTCWALSNEAEALVIGRRSILLDYRENQMAWWPVADIVSPAVFAGHDDGNNCAVFSAHGAGLLVTGGEDETVKLWRSEGKLIATLRGHTDRVYQVALSPNRKYVASATYRGEVKVWKTDSAAEFLLIRDTPPSPTNLTFSADSTMLACAEYGSPGGATFVFRTVTGKRIRQIRPRDTRTSRVGNMRGNMQLETFVDHGLAFSGFHENGRALTTIMLDGTMMTWDMESQRQRVIRTGTPTPNIATPETLERLDLIHFQDVVFSSDGNRAAIVTRVGKIQLLDATSGKVVREVGQHTGGKVSLAMVAGPDRYTIVSGGSDKRILVWRSESQEPVLRITADFAIERVALSKNGSLVAAALGNRQGAVWETATGREKSKLVGHGDNILSIAFHPWGKRIVTGGQDNSVRIWDVDDGVELLNLVHTRPVVSVAFSPDGRRLATAAHGTRGSDLRVYDAGPSFPAVAPGAPSDDAIAPARESVGSPSKSAASPKFGEKWTVPELKMLLVPIKPGVFTMGSPANEARRKGNEKPVRVTLRQPYWMGEVEVTQAQYEAVSDSNPSHFRDTFLGNSKIHGNARPVESVTWGEAVKFCRTLTGSERQAGRLPKGYVYRLPTEAEWEYACRAGTSTPFHTGRALTGDVANLDAGLHTFEVGVLSPNAWGLYDMHGNVAEWCVDGYRADRSGPLVDPFTRSSTEGRVVRGGMYFESAADRRSARRLANDPSQRAPFLGFRIVLAPNINIRAAKEQ